MERKVLTSRAYSTILHRHDILRTSIIVNTKPAKERKDGVLQFRVTQAERKRLQQLKRETGLTFSGIFRQRVLGELRPYKLSSIQKRAHAEAVSIMNCTDISDAEKEKLCQAVLLRSVHATMVAHRQVMQKRERATVKRFKRKSA